MEQTPPTRIHSALLLLLYPAAVMGLVLVAAAHAALGSPLGATFGAELWDLVKSFLLTLVAYGPIAGRVHAVNRAQVADRNPPTSAYVYPHRGDRSQPIRARLPPSPSGPPLALHPKEDHADDDNAP